MTFLQISDKKTLKNHEELGCLTAFWPNATAWRQGPRPARPARPAAIVSAPGPRSCSCRRRRCQCRRLGAAPAAPPRKATWAERRHRFTCWTWGDHMGNFKGKPSYGEIIHWTIHQLLKLGNIMEYHMEFHDIIWLIMAHNLIKPMVDHEQYDHKWVV
jgi:hypothetical protein